MSPDTYEDYRLSPSDPGAMATDPAGDAWGYLVVSDPSQRETLADQRAWAERVAAERGWRLTRMVEDVDSGRDGVRGLMRRLIAELAELPRVRRPARLLTIRLDRFGRGNGLDPFDAFKQIHDLGVLVHTRQDGDLRIDKASDSIVPFLRLWIGAIENEARTDKITEVYRRRRERASADPTVAIGNRAPYGLRIVAGHFVVKDPEAAAVRLAFELRAHDGNHRIAQALKKVAPPWEPREGEFLTQHWTGDRVATLIRNGAYRGLVVDDATWVRAQIPRREIRRATMKYPYALGGALTCACGTPLVGHSGPGARGGRARGEVRYYQCRNVDAHGGRMRHHRTTSVESQFVALLLDLRAPKGLLERYVSAGPRDERKAMMARLSTIRRELANFAARKQRAYELYEGGELPRSEVERRIGELLAAEGQLQTLAAEVEAQLAGERARVMTIEAARSLVERAAETWLSADVEDQRALARAVAAAVGRLIVTHDGVLLAGFSRAQPVGEITDREHTNAAMGTAPAAPADFPASHW
jgi:DNA invertase Pin-like site-specific DNA recombinase